MVENAITYILFIQFTFFENSYYCICSGKFYGKNCENEDMGPFVIKVQDDDLCFIGLFFLIQMMFRSYLIAKFKNLVVNAKIGVCNIKYRMRFIFGNTSLCGQNFEK